MNETHELTVTTSQAEALGSHCDVRPIFAAITRKHWPLIYQALVDHRYPPYDPWSGGERIAGLEDIETGKNLPFSATEFSPRFTHEIMPAGSGCRVKVS